MLKAVFFDMYGTLAGFVPSRHEVQSRACADFGIELTPDGVLRGYGAADRYMNEQNAVDPLRLRDEKGREDFFAEYERLVLQGAGVEVTLERAGEIWNVLRTIPYKLEPFDDVTPTLATLRERGLTLGMISNIDRKGPDVAQDLGIESQLDFIVTSGEVGAEKPDPAIFKAALEKAGASPSEAVHVGDQPSSDVEGALEAGMGAVLLDRDGNHPDFDRCPRIEGMSELPTLLESY